MATQDISEPHRPAAIDRSQSGSRGGSIGMVLIVALALVGAAVGLLLVGRGYAAPYILALLAVLARVGVFSLFALAAGILRVAGKETGNPLLKSMVDGAVDGLLVTDPRGRVIYANAAYLDLTDAADADDVRPVERVFIGDPDVSEAVYRLLKAAREGRSAQEEVRVAGLKGEPARWLRLRVRPLGDGGASRGSTLWTIADVTRDRERQENIFQELQHAIDYLDHAPAGFFSVDAEGDIVLPQRHAGELARPRPGAGRLRRAQDRRHRVRRRRGVAHHALGRARRGEDRGVRYRSQDPRRPHGAGAAVPQGRLRRRRRGRRFAHAGAQPRARRGDRSAARGGSALHALLPEHADGDRHGRQGRQDRAHQRAVRAACSRRRSRRATKTARSCRWSAERDRGRWKARSAGRRRAGRDRAGRAALAGGGERWARFYVSAVEEEERDARSRHRLRARNHRAAHAGEPGRPARRWKRSASSPAASRTISTTCCPPS